MSWSTKDMNPDLKPQDLLALGPQGKERVIRDFILTPLRDSAAMFPNRIPSETTLKGYAESAIDDGFLVDHIIQASKGLHKRFEKFPSYLEFKHLISTFAPVKKTTVDDLNRSKWFDSLSEATASLIEEHGRELVEKLADEYSMGVYDCPLSKWGEWKENIIKLFINDRQRMGKGSTMAQVIAYAKTKNNEKRGEPKPAQPPKGLYTRGSADDF